METRPAGEVEVRETEDGPHLYGSMIWEGRPARRRREIFAPGSVGWPAQGVGIVTEHWSTSPEVRALPERQSDGRITIRAPANDEIQAAVAAGKKFMSVEFFPIRERRTAGGIREITKAFVDMAALVPSAEYPDTGVEVRQTGGYRTRLKTRRPMDCKCAGQGAGAGVDTIQFDAGAFDRVLRDVAAGNRNVSAIGRGAGDVVADTNTGSLTLRTAAGGVLVIDIAALDTEAGRAFEELATAGVEVFARPIIDFDESTFDVDGNVATVSAATFSYILTKPTERTGGQDPLVPRREGRAAAVIPWDRRRWLL